MSNNVLMVEHSNSIIYNVYMKLKHYLKIDGKWYRSLCDKCLAPTQRYNQKYCWHCIERKMSPNFKHDKPHTEITKDLISKKKSKNLLSYHGIHNWLRREYGPANECLNKLCTRKSSKYNWANVSGTYDKDVNSYTKLCASCHISYDRWGHDIEL